MAHPKHARKYPRTVHLPWSPGATDDDIRCTSVALFEGREVVVTEKLDGENTSIYRDGCHARSIDGRHHPSRDWVKGLQARIGHEIPEGWRLCGENLYARHSIAYDELAGYFYLFSVWNQENHCLSWAETEEWAELLDLPLPQILYRGPWDAATVEGLTLDTSTMEGYVVRVADGFRFEDFSRSLAKWVRPSHVTTESHWMHGPVVPNGLKDQA